MILVIDAGNSNIVLGVYQGKNLLNHWRITTLRERTTDEYRLLLQSLLTTSGIQIQEIQGVAVSSVVPPIMPSLEEAIQELFRTDPLIVEPGTKTGISIQYENPREVGADRIVNAMAAFERFRANTIIVDFGTATTFDVVTAKGEYRGGCIAPGIGISIEALFQHASKLPRVEFAATSSVIGKTTVESMQAGLYFGYLSLTDGIVRLIKKGLSEPIHVIATGGYAPLIAKGSKEIQEVDEFITLEGLRLIYEKNQPKNKKEP